jgi:hypothetical protein
LLPKTGIPISNITQQFMPTWVYQWELQALVYPGDYLDTAPYPYYDRWCDDWNVSTEDSTTDTARSFITAAWLAARTSLASQPWRFTNASISIPASPALAGQPVTVTLQVADTNLSAAKIVWEAAGQEPAFGSQTYTLTPGLSNAVYWVEAEVQWPDGRRAFATNSITASTTAPPQLSNPHKSGSAFSFTLAGTPSGTYFVQASTNLTSWQTIATNTLSTNGTVIVTDNQSLSRRFYRALKGP